MDGDSESKHFKFVMEEFNLRNTSVEPGVRMVQPTVDDRIKSPEKQDQFRKMNFAFSFQPIYNFSRIFGLMPFSIIYDSNGYLLGIKTWPLDYLWFVVSICSYILMTLVAYKYLALKQDPRVPYVLTFSDHMLLILGLISGAFFISLDFYNRSKFFDVMKQFNAFDREARVIFDRI